MEYIYHYSSPLGEILLSGNDSSLTGLWFEGQKYYADTLTGPREERLTPVFEQTLDWLQIYFSGQDPAFLPPLSPRGTPFRKEVWDVLLTIPYGQTRTYGEIASVIAARRGLPHMSAQAVGGAVGHNPISLLIPCHRVVGADGSLTGYAGGVDKKAQLLKLEGILTGVRRTVLCLHPLSPCIFHLQTFSYQL